MKKLLPILIGLSLSGFSSLSQAENLMQVYQQARISNPDCVSLPPIVMLRLKKLMKRAVHYCLSLVWVQITPIATATATRTASTLTRPVRRCS